MTPKHLAKIKKVLIELQRSPQGQNALEFEGLARALGRQREKRGKEPTWLRQRKPELARPLSIPAHSKNVKVGTARSIISALLDEVAEGETADEALSNLDQAAASWLAASLAHGQQLAEPMRPFDASGRIALRIPRSLHADIAELAQSQGCSVNQLLTVAISEYVGKLGLPQAGVGLISK